VGESRNDVLAKFFEAGLLLYTVSRRKQVVKPFEPKAAEDIENHSPPRDEKQGDCSW
jgi:hypothetical protein